MQLAGQQLMFSDSYVHHAFGFTPSISRYVQCESKEELERLYTALSADGTVFMPLDSYGFSTSFGGVADRFGVSWQLNLM